MSEQQVQTCGLERALHEPAPFSLKCTPSVRPTGSAKRLSKREALAPEKGRQEFRRPSGPACWNGPMSKTWKRQRPLPASPISRRACYAPRRSRCCSAGRASPPSIANARSSSSAAFRGAARCSGAGTVTPYWRGSRVTTGSPPLFPTPIRSKPRERN